MNIKFVINRLCVVVFFLNMVNVTIRVSLTRLAYKLYAAVKLRPFLDQQLIFNIGNNKVKKSSVHLLFVQWITQLISAQKRFFLFELRFGRTSGGGGGGFPLFTQYLYIFY